MEARGDRSVSAERDIGVAITGDHNQVVLAPGVRSAYWEQVRRIAPPELIDRDRELTDLAAFCAADSGPEYAWWRAGAWAGKTALMSWFALHPPEGVRIVPFFVTARLGAQNDVGAYVDVVLEQLAELVGEGLPANLWESTREAHLQRLYKEAARACVERGERLVLLVDGLDEDRGVTTGAGARSIAGLLPIRPIPGIRVLVSGRLNPPLPVDVPDHHPLRAPEIVRLLGQSQHAQVIRAEAERELKHLIEAGGLDYDLLALVTAAGGGLSAEDLAELTGAVPYTVRDILRTRAGRTFGVRVAVYLLGHEELQAQAEEMLGPAELDRCRRKLHAWADEWETRGWPDGTPEYLLRGYFRMLHATGALDRMLGCALDEARHDQMLVLTGGDVAAVNEVRVTEAALAERGDPPPLDALRLAVHRDWLGDRHAGLPDGLPRAWVALGSASRALALARSFPEAYRRGAELAYVVEELMAQGERGERVLEVLGEAEVCVDQCDDQRLADSIRVRVAHLLVVAGQFDRAAEVARAAVTPGTACGPYTDAVKAWIAAGRDDRAEELVHGAPDEDCARQCAVAVVSALIEAGRLDDAEAAARAVARPDRVRAMVLVVCAWARSGRPPRAHRLMEAVRRLTPTSRGRLEVVKALAQAGDVGRAQVFAEAVRDWKFRLEAREVVAHRLAEVGECDLAESWMFYLGEPGRSAARRDVATALARAGEYDRAEVSARGIQDRGHRSQALVSVAVALAEGNHFDRAEALTLDIEEPERHAEALRGLACCMAGAGEPERGAHLLDALAETGSRMGALVGLAVAASEGGRREWAERLLLDVESRTRVPAALTVAFKVSRAAEALSEAGYRDTAMLLLEDVEELISASGSTGWSVAEESGVTSAIGALAAVREWHRAEALIPRAPDMGYEDLIMRQAAAGIVPESGPNPLPDAGAAMAVVHGLVIAQQFDRAEAYVRLAFDQWQRTAGLSLLPWPMYKAGLRKRAKDIANEMCSSGGVRRSVETALPVIKTLARVGEPDKAEELAYHVAQSYDPRYDLRPLSMSDNAHIMIALGRYDTALAYAELLARPQERAQAQEDLTAALVDVGELARAERLARSIDAPAYAARACTQVAVATSDADQARRLMTLALRSGGWVPVLPALLKHVPEAVPLVVGAANAVKAASRRDTGTPTEARTSAQS